MQVDRTPMDRKVTFSWLLSFYGALLTENQQQMSRLYAEEDFSLSEIAEQFSVSRQSVYDTVTRTEKQLQELEKKLGLCQRFEKTEQALTACQQVLGRIMATAETAEALEEAKAIIQNLLEEEEQ